MARDRRLKNPPALGVQHRVNAGDRSGRQVRELSFSDITSVPARGAYGMTLMRKEGLGGLVSATLAGTNTTANTNRNCSTPRPTSASGSARRPPGARGAVASQRPPRGVALTAADMAAGLILKPYDGPVGLSSPAPGEPSGIVSVMLDVGLVGESSCGMPRARRRACSCRLVLAGAARGHASSGTVRAGRASGGAARLAMRVGASALELAQCPQEGAGVSGLVAREFHEQVGGLGVTRRCRLRSVVG